MDIVTLCHVKKYFGRGKHLVKALDGIDVSFEKGKFTAVAGPSGCGKTTLLNMIGGLYEPTEGAVYVEGKNLADFCEEGRTVYRRRKVGFIFQDYNLIPELTVRENILFPLGLDGARPEDPYFEKITGLLGLQSKLDAKPCMLSGGGQQCAAIARALITKPAIVLADEPTGSLDVKSSQNVAGLLKMTAETFHQTLIMITHNEELAQLADKVVRMRDGKIV